MARTPQFSREAADVRRRALVEAVLASLAERGLGAVSVRDVAARAGVSPGLVRHHFGSFGALLVEAYRHVVQRVDDHIDVALAGAGDDPDARLAAFIAASFSPAIVDRDLLSAWLGFWGLVRSDPEAAALHAETYAAYRGRIEGLLAAAGRARDRALDVRAGGLGLSAMLDGLWLELCLDPATFTPAEATRLAGDWTARFLEGAGAD
ncbi:TetR family transcriptional regulator C-terminal domain-containing protein [Phenylobacterium sp.]|uniref:TetR family transcriptional regulator C-terminal domain-containing protein n=1 Tax=Phenylobacterium sp. TaxID=1871053 RepID=UPI002732E23E|nr:TetR family transcriptional regulator C-terminal domain-containing protein [Phenylobacterium sp.]MDP3854412.1 TetR family transcriptional regulator C-terminal domain-containing protein [Phenylobacterium sp.]